MHWLVDRFGFVYAGGGFSADGGPMTANIIARWDGAQWTALGGGLQGVPTYDAFVNAIATDSRGNLYVGGRFSMAGGTARNQSRQVEWRNLVRGSRWDRFEQ